IWKKLLPSSPTWIPLNENFFDLGGHSILATRLIFEIRSVCRVDVPLNLVFREPTIGGMAKEVARIGLEEIGLDIDEEEESQKQQQQQQQTKQQNQTEQEAEFDYAADYEQLSKTEIEASY